MQASSVALAEVKTLRQADDGARGNAWQSSAWRRRRVRRKRRSIHPHHVYFPGHIWSQGNTSPEVDYSDAWRAGPARRSTVREPRRVNRQAATRLPERLVARCPSREADAQGNILIDLKVPNPVFPWGRGTRPLATRRNQGLHSLWALSKILN